MPSLSDPYGISSNQNQLFEPLRIEPPTPSQPSPADAWTANTKLLTEYLDRQTQWVNQQRQSAIDEGLWNPDTGMPTAKGWVDAAGHYAQGLLAGTTAPEFKGVSLLTPAPRGDVSGLEDRVSTTIPTAKSVLNDPNTIDPHSRSDLQISTIPGTDAHANNADELRYFPDLPTSRLRNPDAVVKAATDHMADTLVWLHNTMRDDPQLGQAYLDRAANWYNGANKIALDAADQYGLQPRQTAAMFANLSPQKDWFQNVSLGSRMLDIVNNKADQQATPEMGSWAADYVAAKAKEADTPTKQAALEDLQLALQHVQGKTYNDLDTINNPDTRAAAKSLWVRAYDEAHNSKDYPVVTPEGELGDTVLNSDGSPRKVAWGSFTEIAKAIQALEGDGSIEGISRGLGGNHKVRSFYNNIISPDSNLGDVTIDTHAIAAAHLRPLGGSDPVVKLGLGMSGSEDATTGSKGAYGIYADAYRQAAQRLGLLPRQLQSITWEGVRGLFSPEQKRDTQFYNDNWDIWNRFKRGDIDADTARRLVLQHGGGIEPPQWWKPPGPSVPPGAPTQ